MSWARQAVTWLQGEKRPLTMKAAWTGDPWHSCPCGHYMLLHDVADLAGNDPLCCVDGCDQQGCRS